MDVIIAQLVGERYAWVLDLIAYLVLIASIVVRLTPTLKDDSAMLGVVRFIGKFIALNKYGPKAR